MGRSARTVDQVSQVTTADQAATVSQVSRDHRVLTATQVLLVLRAHRVSQVQRVFQVCRVHAASQVRWAVVSVRARSDPRSALFLTSSCHSSAATTPSASARTTSFSTLLLSDSTFKRRLYERYS